MSTDTERRELVRPDATVAYWVNGPDRAPLVVLLHGATLDHHAWDAQVEALATRYRVVVPDLRGHGESTLQGAFRFDDAVDDVAALLDEVDDGAPLVLGGLSLAWVATSPRRSCTARPTGCTRWSLPTPAATPPPATRWPRR